MLLVDDDQAQVREGQEQRRARADDDAGARPRDRPQTRRRASPARSECHSAGRRRSASKRAITAWVSAISGSSTSDLAPRPRSAAATASR